jgi:hypothetical protein
MIIPPNQPHHRTLTISQVAHSWASGQIAHAWGNGTFQKFTPYEQICYAAEQHDIGFSRWEREPTLNLKTGLPHTFDELPEKLHFDIWRCGIFELRPVSFYASLIVSFHFCRLCESFHEESAAEEGSEAARFLSEQRAYQKRALEGLSEELNAQGGAPAEAIEFHRRLLGVWDYLSLELCRDRVLEFGIPEVPIGPAEFVPLHVRYLDRAQCLIEVDPWPFGVDFLKIVYGARILHDRFADERTMQLSLQKADPITRAFNLIPRSAKKNAH